MKETLDRRINSSSSYTDKLLKLIPSEIVGAYLVLNNLFVSDIEKSKWFLIIGAVILLILTPAYLLKLYKVNNILQIICTMISYIVWLYSIGSPFKYFGLYNPYLATLFLVIWTLCIPLFDIAPEWKVGQKIKILKIKQESKINIQPPIIWDEDNDYLIGKEAMIMKINKRRKTAYLNIGPTKKEWSLEWLKKIE